MECIASAYRKEIKNLSISIDCQKKVVLSLEYTTGRSYGTEWEGMKDERYLMKRTTRYITDGTFCEIDMLTTVQIGSQKDPMKPQRQCHSS